MAAPNYHSIRALYDNDYITVYQAFNKSIAEAAVREQKLDASPLYKARRGTWIKPSFCWMMYRSGYSYKDEGQERILAIRMRHEHFHALLDQACLAKEKHKRGETVIVQWDPERSPRIGKLAYRSIQIGIPGIVAVTWRNEWIAAIEDVTDMARALKKRIDEDAGISKEELINEGLLPLERVYDDMVPEHIREQLKIGPDSNFVSNSREGS